jgi:hypothetical protein
MKLYCYITAAAEPQGPQPLPANIQNLSDFELLNLGWYWAECIRPDTFVDQYEVFLPLQFNIQATKVICTFIKRDKTQAELDEQNANKQIEVEADKANRLAYAATFMASAEYAALPETLQLEWVGYVSIVENTQTDGLGNAVWNVAFPSVPPTSLTPPPVPFTADV